MLSFVTGNSNSAGLNSQESISRKDVKKAVPGLVNSE